MSLLSGIHHRIKIYDGRSADQDYGRSLTHGRELLRRQKALILRSGSGDDKDEARALKNFIQRSGSAPQAFNIFGRQPRIIRVNPAIERAEQRQDCLAKITEPNETDVFSKK